MRKDITNKGYFFFLIFTVSSLATCGFCIFGNYMSTSSPPFPEDSTLFVGGAGPNNYSTIQEAIFDSSPGDTIFVYAGVYHENLLITKQLQLVGENRFTTIIDGGYDDTIIINEDNVEIADFSLFNTGTGNAAGIVFDYVTGAIVHHCIIDNVYNGLRFLSTDSSVIVDNSICNCTNMGIYLDSYSNVNTLLHNNFLNNIPNHAYDEGYDNVWYNPINQKGNYWDDYTGGDTNGDGIGDIPYGIPWGNEDLYPLMSPYQWIEGFPPIATFEFLINETTASFNASASYDPDGVIVLYTWVFGDGENGTGIVVNHTYSENGVYTISLEVVDNDRTSDTKTTVILVGEDLVPPEITCNTPALAYTGDSFTFNATIVDIPVTSNTKVDDAWVEYWYSGGSHKKTKMTESGNNHYIKVITIADTLATLHYIISANDTSDNWNSTSVRNVVISDNDHPVISNTLARPDPQYSGGTVNITCTVVDNIGVSLVKVNITNPTGPLRNITMINCVGTDTYYYNDTYIESGLYVYYIYAKDVGGNGVRTFQASFWIDPSLDTYPPRFVETVLSHSILPEDTDGNPTWGETTNISVVIDDESNVTSVTINLTSLGYSILPLIQITGTTQWYITISACIGTSYHNGTTYLPHLLEITAVDEYGNGNTTCVEVTIWKNGDVSGNGKVTLFDATYLAKWYLDMAGFEDLHENIGDVSGNGKVTLFDATYLAKWYLNMEGFEELK